MKNKITCSECFEEVNRSKYRYCPYCGNDLDIQFYKSEVSRIKNNIKTDKQILKFDKEFLNSTREKLRDKYVDTNSINNKSFEDDLLIKFIMKYIENSENRNHVEANKQFEKIGQILKVPNNAKYVLGFIAGYSKFLKIDNGRDKR